MKAAATLALALLGLGGPIRLRDVAGGTREALGPSAKPARVLFIINHDCPISNSYVPEMNRIYRDYLGRNVGFLAVYSEADTPIGVEREHAKAYGFLFPAAADPEFRLAAKVGATVTPEAVVLSRQGTVVYRGRIDDTYASLGVRRLKATTHDLRDALDQVLSGHPVTRPETPAIGCYLPKRSS